MCDIQVVRKEGVTYFAKNSDRDLVETQLVERIAPVNNDKTKKLKATHIEIDQTADRFGAILSRPYWIWGAEMGANDQGVVIGNEAIFSKVREDEDGLIGMDLLRLGLERGGSAQEALFIITSLLEKYGQGGICSIHSKISRYDNSFIIADANEIWILETAQRHWVAKKVDTFAAISNCLTLGESFDLKSEGLEDFARKKGLFSQGDFHFAKTFDTRFFPYVGSSQHRLSASLDALQRMVALDQVSLQDAMNNLRIHKSPTFSHRARRSADLCMHATGIRSVSQTCGSMVSFLSSKNSHHFFTGTSSPCLSIFKPTNFDYSQSFGVLNQQGIPIQKSLWQRHERVHRHLMLNSAKLQDLRDSRDIAEQKMLTYFENLEQFLSVEDFQKTNQLVMEWQNQWYEYYKELPFHYTRFSSYSSLMKKSNKENGID